MSNTQIILIIAGVAYYIYSAYKDNDAQKNRKTPSNPTPSKKSTLDDILQRMLEQQRKNTGQLNKPEPIAEPKANKKLVFGSKKEPQSKKQGLPFENRKLTEPREMPSRKQIEKVIIREKKAVEQPVIKVKDYDVDLVDHDLPHPQHHLSDNSKIKFHFKEEEQERFEFDARQAIIAQIILERKY